MTSERYPRDSVRVLLPTDHVSPATRGALEARLVAPGGRDAPPCFLDPHLLATLRAVGNRLLPQPDRSDPIDLAGAIDARLADGQGDGWRYADLPPDRDAVRLGLRGVDETARLMFGATFVELPPTQRDDVLRAVQRGEPLGDAWRTMSAARFFEELLAETCEIYYSHPLAQEEIGYVGMADLPGWQAIGLDRLDAREPRPIEQPDGRD